MSKKISIVSILQSSWTDFKKWKFTFFIFTSTFFLLFTLLLALYVAYIALDKAVMLSFILTLIIVILLYPLMVSKNVLNIVYHRQLHWFKVPAGSSKIFIFTFMTGCFNSLLSKVMKDTNPGVFMLSCILSFLLWYLSIRMSFVQQILLEQQGTINRAFGRSWQLTENRFCLLFISRSLMISLFLLPLLPLLIFVYSISLVAVTTLSFYTSFIISLLLAVGLLAEFYIVLPVLFLMRSHLFKALVESENL